MFESKNKKHNGTPVNPSFFFKNALEGKGGSSLHGHVCMMSKMMALYLPDCINRFFLFPHVCLYMPKHVCLYMYM